MTLSIDPKAKAAIEPHLDPGEKLLWAGRPMRHPYRIFFGIAFVYSALLAAMLNLFVLGALVAGFAIAIKNGDVSFLIAGLLFAPIFPIFGFPMLKITYFHFRQVPRCVYAVSNVRALIVLHSKRDYVLTLSLEDMREYETKRRGALGDIIFKPKWENKKRLKNYMQPHLPPEFCCIKQSDSVERLITNLVVSDLISSPYEVGTIAPLEQ